MLTLILHFQNFAFDFSNLVESWKLMTFFSSQQSYKWFLFDLKRSWRRSFYLNRKFDECGTSRLIYLKVGQIFIWKKMMFFFWSSATFLARKFKQFRNNCSVPTILNFGVKIQSFWRVDNWPFTPFLPLEGGSEFIR